MSVDVKKFLQKIHDDEEFYMENYLKIRTKNGQLKNFQMNKAQNKCLKIIKEKKKLGKPIRVIWLKARQLGISTFCEGLIFHDTANNPFKNSLIIAHEDKATQNLFNMSKLFYEELPPAIRPMKKYSNEQALTFENPTNNDDEKYKNPGLRSKITVATAKNVQTARSNTIHNLHASEVAFWDDPETLMTGMLQCIPDIPNSMVFIESTANGIGGWFYDLWKRSERGETDYIPIFLAWFDNPDYTRGFDTKAQKNQFINEATRTFVDDKGSEVKSEELILRETFGLSWEQLNWRRWCINNNCNGDIEKFHQEYPSTPDEAFIATGRPVFQISALKKYQSAVEKPIRSGYLKDGIFTDDDKGYIKIWKEPEQDKFYVIGGDVAEGLATGDYSCAVVLDEDYELCAAWHGHIDPDLFGDELTKLGNYYNEAYVAPESNNHGHTAVRAMIRNEYYNLYYQKNYNKLTNDISQKPGWSTNKRTKPLMIDSLNEFVREIWLRLPWDTLISELFTYVRADDGSMNAQTGCHDDTVMALAIALQLLLEGRGENYAPEQPNERKNRNYFDGENDEMGTDIDKDSNEEYTI